jgi:hypothetical protein
VDEFTADKNKHKTLFLNAANRTLLGVWLLHKGGRLPLNSLGEFLSLQEEALEAKLQTFAGLGLIQVTTDAAGERQVNFLPGPPSDLEKSARAFFDGRQNDFKAIEAKFISLLYKILLTTKIDPNIE